MKYLITILFLIFTFIESISQDSIKYDYQRIYYSEEINEINDFIKNFFNCSTPEELKKHIAFPDFTASHRCGGNYKITGSTGTELTKYYNSDKEIRSILEKLEDCSNPFHFYLIKELRIKEFQDSLKLNNLSLEEYFFDKRESQLKYLKWFINEYRLPLNLTKINLEDTRISETQSYILRQNKRIQISILKIHGWGYYSLEIYKLNSEYKMRSVKVEKK